MNGHPNYGVSYFINLHMQAIKMCFVCFIVYTNQNNDWNACQMHNLTIMDVFTNQHDYVIGLLNSSMSIADEIRKTTASAHKLYQHTRIYERHKSRRHWWISIIVLNQFFCVCCCLGYQIIDWVYRWLQLCFAWVYDCKQWIMHWNRCNSHSIDWHLKNPIDIKSQIKYNKLTAIGIELDVVKKRRTAILWA